MQNEKKPKLLSILLIITLAIININLVQSASTLNPKNLKTNYTIQKIGNFSTGFSDINDIYVKNNRLFAATSRSGLVVLDISDLYKPVIENVIDDDKEITENQLWDSTTPIMEGIDGTANYTYIADGKNGLLIVDIEDPKNPVIVKNYNELEPSIANIKVFNKLAFTHSSRSIKIIDINNPTSPSLLGAITFDYTSEDSIRDFTVKSKYLYISTANDLLIYDISNPGLPIE